MIQLVIEASSKVISVNHIYIATDDQRIYNFVESLGIKPPRFQESCHPSDQHIRGLEDMTNASIQRGRQG